MPVSKGRSCARAEFEQQEYLLKKMIEVVETYYHTSIESLRTHISQIVEETNSYDESVTLTKQLYEELDEMVHQRYIARNNLVIIVYSITEQSLAEICTQYVVPLLFSPQNKAKRYYYLSDFLFSLGVDYNTQNSSNAAFMVHTAIRELRNHCTHSGNDLGRATAAVAAMGKAGFTDIVSVEGVVQIHSDTALYKILQICCLMLEEAEGKARSFYDNYSNK